MTHKMLKSALLLGTALAFASPAAAADLGGNCCADLEERIAELEATTARKGNKKVSLQVYGQVNAGIVSIDTDVGFDDTRVLSPGGDTQGSFVGFGGRANIGNGWSAGFVLEIEARDYGLLGNQQSLEIQTRQSFLWLKSDTLGGLSIGKVGNATNQMDEITTANTAVASRPLSLQPISDTYLAGLDLPLDGSFRNVVRYDSPSIGGFYLSASWGASGPTPPNGQSGDMWDAALRYVGEFQQIRVVGGLGYRVDDGQELQVNLAGLNLAIPTGAETKTFLASGSVMHMPSGLFVSAYYADQEWSQTADFDLTMWQVQGGIETRLTALGKTTFFGEYGELDISAGGGEPTPNLWGLGVVQAIDAAAMDLYATYRTYDLDLGADDGVDVFMAGARIKF